MENTIRIHRNINLIASEELLGQKRTYYNAYFENDEINPNYCSAYLWEFTPLEPGETLKPETPQALADEIYLGLVSMYEFKEVLEDSKSKGTHLESHIYINNGISKGNFNLGSFSSNPGDNTLRDQEMILMNRELTTEENAQFLIRLRERLAPHRREKKK